jgi:hypothetical protein
VPFLRRYRDPAWQLAPQDLVLDLQILDMPGKLLLCGAGDHLQERLINVGHWGKMH